MHSKIKRFRKRLLLAIVFILFVIYFIHYLSQFAIIGFNRTASLNGYVYLVVKDISKINKGDLVAFYPGVNRFNKNGEWFVKQVVGVEGDVIEVVNREFFINGESIGIAKETTASGFKLKALNEQIIDSKKYFMWTPHKDSFDSRYEMIGLIDEKNIFGIAYKLL